jgi:hypothetical protein
MRAPRITDPKEIGFTPRVRDVLSALDSEGKSHMLDQLFDALEEAREEEDLTPINTVIETWYRSKLFVERGVTRDGEGFLDEFKNGVKEIITGDDDSGASLEDVRKRLDLDLTKRPKHQ